MILGEMIQAWREKHKVSRRKLASMIGVDHVSLSRLENNDVRAVSMETLAKIHQWIYSQPA